MIHVTVTVRAATPNGEVIGLFDAPAPRDWSDAAIIQDLILQLNSQQPPLPFELLPRHCHVVRHVGDDWGEMN